MNINIAADQASVLPDAGAIPRGPSPLPPANRLDGGPVAEGGHASDAEPAPGQRHGAGRRARVLLVEDDRKLADALEEILSLAGFHVYIAHRGTEALALVRSYRFDLVLLDLSLPDISGHDVMLGFREVRAGMPVIILSGAGSLHSKLSVFEDGADDYVTKPFQADELIARIHAVLRRARSAAPTEITIGRLTMDLTGRRALVDGLPVPLTAKEYACLEFLISRRGSTVTKEMFLAHLYGGHNEPEMKIIDVFVCKLRRKLREAGVPNLIETVWGRGYTVPAAH